MLGRCPAHDAVWWGVGGQGVLHMTAGFPGVPESPIFLAPKKFLRIPQDSQEPGIPRKILIWIYARTSSYRRQYRPTRPGRYIGSRAGAVGTRESGIPSPIGRLHCSAWHVTDLPYHPWTIFTRRNAYSDNYLYLLPWHLSPVPNAVLCACWNQ